MRTIPHQSVIEAPWRPMLRALGWFVATPEGRVDIWKMGDGFWRWTVCAGKDLVYVAKGESQGLIAGQAAALAAGFEAGVVPKY